MMICNDDNNSMKNDLKEALTSSLFKVVKNI